jgi:hypothetical protein
MRTDFDQEKTQAPFPERGVIGRDPRYDEACTQARPMSDAEILAALFSYHPPNNTTLPKYGAINQAAKNFAEVVLQNCPRCSDRSAAIELIRTARMTANAAVALDGLSL